MLDIWLPWLRWPPVFMSYLELPLIFPIWPCSPFFLSTLRSNLSFTCCILQVLQSFRLFVPDLRWPPKLRTSYIICEAWVALVPPWCCISKALAEGMAKGFCKPHWAGGTVKFTLALYREKAAEEARPPASKCCNEDSIGQMPGSSKAGQKDAT